MSEEELGCPHGIIPECEACTIDRLRQWVHDLQSGMYINCVYCGHRYGPSDEVPASMADVLKEHVEQCPKHPMSALKAELAGVRERTVAGIATALERLAKLEGNDPAVLHIMEGLDKLRDEVSDAHSS